MIYFIRAIDDSGSYFGPVKIGWTSRLARDRIREMQPCSPVKLGIVLNCLGGRDMELWLHRRFKHLRLHGEWFRADRELLDMMELFRDHMAK